MKAKLVKTERKGRYLLLEETEHGWKPCLLGKLSKQNCDEIFGVLDVEKIADRHTFGQRNHEWKAYIAGFNKNAELNKDKVFTLGDVEKIIHWATLDEDVRLTEDEMLQSLQQPTEIEVEIEMESSKFIVDKSQRDDVRNGFNYRPKLDSEGCLILKKI